MSEMKDRNVWVMDIETLKNAFTYTGLNIDTQQVVQYVIHESRNDYDAFMKHLSECKAQIGFNSIGFDYPVIHAMLKGEVKTAEEIYAKAQAIINVPEDDKFRESVAPWDWIIYQLDLYKLNHFDNQAKRTSLKALEFWMNYPNVQDMPISHTEAITASQIPSVLEYNLNDVEATYAFYKLCLDKINLRRDLSREYSIDLTNANDPKIGSDIFLDLLSKDMKVEKKWLKKQRTSRPTINLKEIILPCIKFNSTQFNVLLDTLKAKEIMKTKGSLDNSVIYKGFKYDFGAGGIHGCINAGIYQADDQYVIQDIDVASFYPNLAINNEFKPEHLGESFSKIYKQLYVTRAKAKKEGNKAVNEGLKLALNGSFGNMINTYSYLYDPKCAMSITINGQLLIAMLAEQIVDQVDTQVLQVNTDGITIRYKKQDVNTIDSICKQWQEMTSLELEYKNYSKMVIMDVNNYLGVFTDGKVKYKGLFEILKDYHKDTSFRIIPIALSEYFVNGIPLMDTLLKHKNIYDFCGRARFKSTSFGETRFIGTDHTGLPAMVKEKQQKTTRYFISTNGSSFLKVYTKVDEKTKEVSYEYEAINKGYLVTIFNKYVEQQGYSINYKYYYKECMKILETIENKQLTLI